MLDLACSLNSHGFSSPGGCQGHWRAKRSPSEAEPRGWSADGWCALIPIPSARVQGLLQGLGALGVQGCMARAVLGERSAVPCHPACEKPDSANQGSWCWRRRSRALRGH